MPRNQGNRSNRDSGRNSNNNRSNSRSERSAFGWSETAREKPLATAAAIGAAAAAGAFLWSRRNQISEQLSNLSDQIGEWSENMSYSGSDDNDFESMGAGGASGSMGGSAGMSGGNRSIRGGSGMSETGGGNASLGAASGGGGMGTAPSGRGRAKTAGRS